MNRHHQRGFIFGLGLLGSVIASVIGASVILGAIYGFDQWRQAAGRAEIEEKYQPIKSACDTLGTGKTLFGNERKLTPEECAKEMRSLIADNAKCTAANITLQEDVDTIRAQRDLQNAAVAKMQRAGAYAQSRKAEATAAAQGRLSELAAQNIDLVASLGDRRESLKCDKEIAAMLDAALKQQARDHPPPGNYPPPGHPAPGDTLKVVK